MFQNTFFFPEIRTPVAASRRGVALLAIAAALTGAAFENLGAGIALGMAGASIVAHRSDRSSARRLGIVALCYALGWIALVAAPSTAARAQYYRDAFSIPPLSAAYLAKRALDVGHVLATSTGGLAITTTAAAAFALCLGVRARDLVLRRHAALALAVAPSIPIVALAPYTEARSFAGLWMLLLVLAVRAHHLARRRHARLVEVVTAVCAAAWRTASASRKSRSISPGSRISPCTRSTPGILAR